MGSMAIVNFLKGKSIKIFFNCFTVRLCSFRIDVNEDLDNIPNQFSGNLPNNIHANLQDYSNPENIYQNHQHHLQAKLENLYHGQQSSRQHKSNTVHTNLQNLYHSPQNNLHETQHSNLAFSNHIISQGRHTVERPSN